MIKIEKCIKISPRTRGGGVVPCEAHNLKAPVQFRPPQHFCRRSSAGQSDGLISRRSEVRDLPPAYYGGVDQWLDRHSVTVEVAGSSPVVPASHRSKRADFVYQQELILPSKKGKIESLIEIN